MGVRAGLEYPEGDPGGLTAAAGRLSGLAFRLAGGAGDISRAGRVPGWEGNRFLVFSAALQGLAPDLVTAAGALRRAARSVEDLAERIETAQRQIRRWAREIEEAEQQAQAAQTVLADARLQQRLFGDLASPFPGRVDPVRDAQAGFDRAGDRVAELRNRYVPKARRLCEEVEAADRRAAGAVHAAAAAAPAGGAGAPGGPRLPSGASADVRLFAPVWLFAPGESYLPADPRRNVVDLVGSDSLEDYLRGQGTGAPIFYRERDYPDGEKVIEYWFYRRYNHFRDLPGDPSKHFDDAEAVAVRLRDGRPVQIGYSQHDHGCSLPYADAPKKGGHPVSYPGDGSGSNSPYTGHDDDVAYEWLHGHDDLHGPAPGEETPPGHVVRGEDNLVDYDAPEGGEPWPILDQEDRKVPGEGGNATKFVPGAAVWADRCEELPARE